MKIGIRNYRSVLKADISIKKNDINYIMGSNESGKTNILNGIRILDMNNQNDFEPSAEDKTLKNDRYVNNEIKVVIQECGSTNSFGTDGSSSRRWYYVESENKKNLLEYIAKNITKNLKDWTERINLEEEKVQLPGLTKDTAITFLNNLSDGKYVPKKDRNLIEEYIEEFKVMNDIIEDNYNDLRIDIPRIIYIEPILKAKEKQNTSYPYDSLFEENSTLRNICKKFLNEEEMETIKGLATPIEDQEQKARYRYSLFDNLNKKVKEYFEKFEHIRAYPLFRSDESRVILDIKSKDSWSIDSGDENERSLGYKSFLRIVTELISIEASTEETIYIIDEPEQSLHPYLQEELSKTMREIIDVNNHLTIILVTHSPFMIQEDPKFSIKSTSFVYRGEDGGTLVDSLSDSEKVTNKLIEFKSKKITQDNYLFKILFSSLGWKRMMKLIENDIDDIQKKLEEGKLTSDEFFDAILQSWKIQENS